MTTKRALSPIDIERELRRRLTDTEYRVLQARLTGSVKAIAMLRERAPDLLPLMFGTDLEQAKHLPMHTQSALAMVVAELLAAAARDRQGHIDRRRILKLVQQLR